MLVTVASGKGGTGKAGFAVNPAYVLAEREQNRPETERKHVRLLDCDVEGPTACSCVQTSPWKSRTP